MTTEQVEKAIQEIWAMFRETDRQFKETDKRLDKRFEELGKEIGGLGRKFGWFTEGMAFPSMERILTEKFEMEYISPRVRKRMNDEEMELDVFAYANEKKNEAIIVEVKSRLKEEHIDEMLNTLNRFKHFFPEHKDKALYGIIAAVDVSEQMKQKVYQLGLYLAMIRNDTFVIEVPEEFKPKRYN